MRTLLRPLAIISLMLIPISTLALEGIGPRVAVVGTVEEIRITEKQKFDESGGELKVLARNNQLVTVIIDKTTKIISEGKMSRRSLLPADIQENMDLRIRGWRLDTKSLIASLIVIVNLENSPALSGNGVIQSFGEGTVTLLLGNGSARTFRLSNETEVHFNYKLTGKDALSLTGKQALYTVNPREQDVLRVLRITGLPPAQK